LIFFPTLLEEVVKTQIGKSPIFSLRNSALGYSRGGICQECRRKLSQVRGFCGIAYVAHKTRALILKNPLITDWSESTINHGDDSDGRSSGFVRAMFFIH
jgi:hypothetical protein